MEVVTATDDRQEFFEDAPHLGEEFEDWLSIERARSRVTVSAQRAEYAEEEIIAAKRICVALYPTNVSTDDPHANLIADRITSHLLQNMCQIDMYDVLDLTTLPNERTGSLIPADQQVPDVALQVSLSKVRSLAEVGVRAFDPRSRHVFWSASISADQSTTFLFSADQLDEFANQAFDSVYTAILRRVDRSQTKPGSRPKSIFGAVHQVLGMSPSGQKAARDFFRDHPELETSSVASAWYAFSLANTLGEGGDVREVAEEADAYCRRAVELDPTNALSLALVSHVQSFVLRRLDLGLEFSAQARRVAPTLAITWDLSAMNALYRGQLEEAADFSRRAIRLSRFSPYRPLYESSQAITASLSGNHDLAIATASRVLNRIPHFLGVERHLSASLASMGRISESRAVVENVRRRDPYFVSEMLDDPKYPLPSQLSVELIRKGFSTIGLNG